MPVMIVSSSIPAIEIQASLGFGRLSFKVAFKRQSVAAHQAA